MSFGGQKVEGQKEAVWKTFVFSGLSGMVASAATHPLDLIKVRMQINQAAGKGDGVSFSDFKSYSVISLARVKTWFNKRDLKHFTKATYTTARIGFYIQVKEWIAALQKDRKGPPPLWEKFVAGMSAGAIGAFVGSPADIVMVRMQADGKKPPEQRVGYKHAFDGLIRITKDEGIAALWRGSGPNIIRAMLMNTAQVASYDQSKQLLLQNSNGLFKDDVVTHFTASTIAAFIATVVCNPVDVVKTRVMNSRKDASGAAQYKNSMDCARKTLITEGPLAFYKGFWPFFARLAPHTIIVSLYEQLSKLANKLGI